MAGNYTAAYETADATEAGTDLVVGVLVGVAGLVGLIGLGIALGMVGKYFGFLPKL